MILGDHDMLGDHQQDRVTLLKAPPEEFISNDFLLVVIKIHNT